MTEKESQLKPCYGCGEPMFEISRQAMKAPMLVCQNEINCYFSNIEILPRYYEDCWAHKRIADLEKDRADANRYLKDYREMHDSQSRLLDKQGKVIDKYEEALESIAGFDCEVAKWKGTPCGLCVSCLAREALQSADDLQKEDK